MNGMYPNQMPMYTNPYQVNQNNMFRQPLMPQSNNGINWVQGIEGAKAYQIQPNSNIVLLDSEQNKMYIKTSDNIGMCTLRIFNFEEETGTSNANNSNNIDMSKYVTREEFNEILSKLGGNEDAKQSVQSNTTKSKSKSIITE